MAELNQRRALRYAKALDGSFQNLSDRLFEMAVKSIAEKLLQNAQIAAIEYPIFDTGLFSASHVLFRNGQTSTSLSIFDGLRTTDEVGIFNDVSYFYYAIRPDRHYQENIDIPEVNINIEKLIL